MPAAWAGGAVTATAPAEERTATTALATGLGRGPLLVRVCDGLGLSVHVGDRREGHESRGPDGQVASRKKKRSER